ncbi:MAG: 3-oxoacyl-ACP synthase [Caulobacteraceae bacterium]|nr:MAG: 3-oxoacyl-ACP synthase [Caulobacteraceae bacterium]
MIGFRIAGWGAYRPRQQLASTALDARLGKAAGWVEQSFGIASRGVAGADETTSMMAAQAARAALAMAGWAEGDFGVLIGGCGVMEQPIPSTAILVQNRLGLGRSGIPVFDVNQTCLSFLSALDVAAMGIAVGRWGRAVVFASDIASAGLDPADPKVLSIFGDGAAAIAIEAQDGPAGLLSARFESYGEGQGLATLKAGGTRLRVEEGYDALVAGSRFQMDAFGIFKAAARRLPRVIDKVLAEAGVEKTDLKAVVCHQASAPGVAHVQRLFGEVPVIDIFATTGNQIAASLPTVLAHALDAGRVARGDVVMMLGTAAGISAGAMVLRL